METRGREGRVRGTVLMFLERPDRVRFDVMTQFGAAAILTSDGDRFPAHRSRENRYLEGPTCPTNIGRLLGVELEGSEVARFLMGDTPRLPDAEAELVCEGEGYRVTLTAADGRRQELVFFVPRSDAEVPPAEQHLRLRRSELFDAEGESTWRVTYDDYRPVPGTEGVQLPFVVQFVDRRNDADTLVRFQDIATNVEVPEGAFEQSPPGGMTPEYVSCE